MQMLDIEVQEYFVTHIGKVDRLSGSCVRVVMGVAKDQIIEPRYAFISPIECLLSHDRLVARIRREIDGELVAH